MKRFSASLIVTTLAFVGVAAHRTVAQTFDLSWYTMDAGGGTSSGGIFSLSGTIGQPDAGPFASPMMDAGGVFEMVGGFWQGAASQAPCPGDLNGDRQVNLTDLTQLLSHFGVQSEATLADGDSDGDGDVDLSDLTNLLSNFGVSCP